MAQTQTQAQQAQEYCWVGKTEFEELKKAASAGGIVSDIANVLRYCIVQAFMFSRFKAARFSPWNPLVKTFIPEVACEDGDQDGCDHGILLLDSVEELGKEVYKSGKYAIEGTILEKVYGKRGFTEVYEFYDYNDRRGVAVCTDTRPTVCVTLYYEEDEDDC